jgi:hypothetical protein
LSLGKDRLVGASAVWTPAFGYLFADFKVSIDHAARVLAAGGDPYGADWICQRLPYPPLVTRLFLWVVPLGTDTAARIWMAAHVLILAGGAWAAWATRRRLGLGEVPRSVAVAAVLLSAPAVYAVERGQCDALALPFLLAGSWMLARGSKRSEVLAGALFGLAAWVKFYPGIALLGLIGFRRWRAVAGFVAAGLAVGLADPVGVLHALGNAYHIAPPRVPKLPGDMVWWDHSLCGSWRPLWAGTALARLGRLPGAIAAAAVAVPFLAWVSHRVGRSGNVAGLAFPLSVWLVAAGTFLPKWAMDYNLIFLPLAIVAVWDARDRPAVHMLMALALLALQPFLIVVGGRVLLLWKIAGVVAAGLCLVQRAGEPAPAPAAIEAHPHRPPHFPARLLPDQTGRVQ